MNTPDDAGETTEPLPRDPQNQQSVEGEDPLAIPVPDWPDSDLPHTDVAGTARRDRADDDGTDQEGKEGSALDEPVD